MAVACSSSSPSTTGKGGSGGGGGKGGSGGSGGTTDASTGGSTGTGGLGGGTGGGGDGGATCTTAGQYTHTSSFGAILDGWVVGPNSSFGLPTIPDPDGGPPTGTVLTIDPNEGSPGGSAKLVIPFTIPGQQFLFEQLYTAAENFTDTTVTALVKLDTGGIVGPTDTVRAYLTLKSTTSYIYVAGTSVVLDPSVSGFQMISIDADMPTALPTPGYTPCDIRELDVEIDTGTSGNYTTATVHIDTITVSSKHAADAGSGDAADASGSDATTPSDAATDATGN